MNISIISKLPLKRIGALATHPENTHLRALHTMALSCGNGSLFVECGQTNGAVTYTMACALQHQPDSRLLVLGPVAEHVAELLTTLKVLDRVSSIESLDEIKDCAPDLVFIGAPDTAIDSTEWALAVGARVICLYDVRTTERYRLPQFSDNALAAADLKQAEGRTWNELSNAISFEQARRGMLVSEVKKWDRSRKAASRPLPTKKPVAVKPQKEEVTIEICPPAVEVMTAAEEPARDTPPPAQEEEAPATENKEPQASETQKNSKKKGAKFKKKGKSS